MNKLYRSIPLLLVFITCLCSCSSDNDDETAYYDSEYQVTFYKKPPYAHLEQGHWYDGKFIKYIPNAKAPYYLLLIPKDAEGKKIIDNLVEKKMVSDLYKIDNSDHYFVTSDSYFESPHLYVSDHYYLNNNNNGIGDILRVTPCISLKLKDNYGIENIQRKYINSMTLKETKGKGWTVYYFDCHVTNSYEALKLASELCQREDVSWAETSNYSPIYTFDN